MRYLGIDYGRKRIGLAVSSEGIAFPRGVVANDASLFAVLKDLIVKEKIGRIVVGDTRSFGNRENPITKEADAFIERLKSGTEVPVVAAMEVGSSIEASRYAGADAKHDDAAAAIILQRFLEARAVGH